LHQGEPLPSIALAVICKNERENFPRLLESVRGCFDEIHVTDTGSTDGTLDLLEGYRKTNPSDSPLLVHHFEWVRDFSAARNYAFSHPKTDYIAWLDLDDALDNATAFQHWRDTVMGACDLWLNTYHYGGIRPDGVSPCKFMRERVIKNGLGLKWNFFVHEGILPMRDDGKPCQVQYATSWSVIHKRTDEDMAKDRSRNLQLFEGRGKLVPRMQYYYGKELFENNRPLDAYTQLVEAVKHPDLEMHDRIMGIQYACMAAMQCSQFAEAIQLAHNGLQLAPNRAEFHIVIGDALVKQSRIAESIPFFSAAKACQRPDDRSPFAGAIFSHADAYGHYPRHQLARCYFHTARLAEAKKELTEATQLGPNIETVQLSAELDRVSQDLSLRGIETYQKTDEIVISTVPVPSCKGWDEDSLATRGLGGSETAVIHMARALRDLTGLRVRVFNERETTWERDGVSYEPLAAMYTYFREKLPKAHIAWRHNFKLTPAPTYLWCHDLNFLAPEQGPHYTKVLALSEFHKAWLHNTYAVPLEKIAVTRNGIDPKRYQNPADSAFLERNWYKVVYSSSPDRGLDRAIRVMDHVVKEIPEAELHVFYGFNGMRAHGLHKEVAELEAMIAERPFVKFHGNVTQERLTTEFRSSAVWLYPTNFLETFCITAIEALCAGVYPVVRKFGALPDTLKEASKKCMAAVIDRDCATDDDCEFYAKIVTNALRVGVCDQVQVGPQRYSWRSVAAEWVELLGLKAGPG
jgi:glycosyltransferase involved in cell wall biosynthesis